MDKKFTSLLAKFSKNNQIKTNQKLINSNLSKSCQALPSSFFFSDRKKVNNIHKIINNLPENAAIIIREYDLSYNQRLKFAQQIILNVRQKAAKKSLKVFIGKDWRLAIKTKADGVHFSDLKSDFLKQNYQPNLPLLVRKKFLTSLSCHTLKSIKKAEKLQYNVAFYSPIFFTTSHPKQKTIGIYNLRKVTISSKIAIFALGGINKTNIKQLATTKICGIGGISIFCDE